MRIKGAVYPLTSMIHSYMDADGVTLKRVTIKVMVKISSWGEIHPLQRPTSQSIL